jgi:hypothetical protein
VPIASIFIGTLDQHEQQWMHDLHPSLELDAVIRRQQLPMGQRPVLVMTQVQAARERLERLRASIEENIRKSKVIVEESKALLGMLQRERSRYKSA